MPRPNSDFVLGLAAIALAAVAIAGWVPFDTGSGIVEKVRGKLSIGDALAPTVAFVLLAGAGALLAVEARHGGETARLTRANLAFLGLVVALFAVSIALMRWTGPLATTLLRAVSDFPSDYRDLRDTVPWKHLGFVAGGSFMVGGFISLVERRASLRAVLIGLGATLAMIALYDLPFEDLLLPPNGDV